VLAKAVDLGVERSPFPIEIHEITPEQKIAREEYDIEAFAADHGGSAVGYTLREHTRLGRFNPDKARELGVPEGPLWGKIHKGETIHFEVTRPDGSTEPREVSPGQPVGAPRPGRVVVISGDTRPSQRLVTAADGADLLVHEATFGEEEKDRAKETGHSTAVQAAQVALAARVKKLVLTHLSARYSAIGDVLGKEAREVFPETIVAKDGLTVEVPFDETTGERGD
jgi:ribonuclease Z